MNKFKDYISKLKEAEKKSEKPQSKELSDTSETFSGIIYSPQKGTQRITYNWDEYAPVFNPPSKVREFPARKKHRACPLARYKSEEKNELINFWWHEMMQHGMLEILEQEQCYRIGAIELVLDFKDWVFSFKKGMKGFLYDQSYIQIFPGKYREMYLQGIERGLVLVGLTRRPLTLPFCLFESQIALNMKLIKG